MTGDADVAGAAALIAEPARARLLVSLTEHEALPASELAARAAIAPSTASEHLAKLLAGGLVVDERHGRHRYFRLADPAVAAAIEALAAVARPLPVRSLRDASVGEALRYARTCYDHLAGRLGVELAAALERDAVILASADGVALGPRADRLEALGVDLAAAGRKRRPLLRTCLDWSERRPHVAGALGAAIASRLFELGWITRRPANRSVAITPRGLVQLRTAFGIELSRQPHT